MLINNEGYVFFLTIIFQMKIYFQINWEFKSEQLKLFLLPSAVEKIFNCSLNHQTLLLDFMSSFKLTYWTWTVIFQLAVTNLAEIWPKYIKEVSDVLDFLFTDMDFTTFALSGFSVVTNYLCMYRPADIKEYLHQISLWWKTVNVPVLFHSCVLWYTIPTAVQSLN